METHMKLRSNRDVDDLNAKWWSTCSWNSKLKGRFTAKKSHIDNLNSQRGDRCGDWKEERFGKRFKSDHEVNA
jgi:hypothetical protein